MILLPCRLKVDYSHAAYLVSFFLKKSIILNSLNCALVRESLMFMSKSFTHHTGLNKQLLALTS